MTFTRSLLLAAGPTLLFTLFMAASAAFASSQTGIASWYQMGTRTANGEAYNPDGMTAAHRSLPFGTMVRVENLRNGRSVVLRINDRGPFVGGRIIDVSRGGARQLDLIGSGTAKVRVTPLSYGAGKGGKKYARSRDKDDDQNCIIRICL